MYEGFFRIGFGGCGCALVDHFEEHANVIFRNHLLNCYVYLADWRSGLSNESRLRFESRLKRLKEILFEKKIDFDTLDKHLKGWESLWSDLLADTPWMDYEKDVVEDIKDKIILMRKKVKAIKDYDTSLLENLTVDSFGGGTRFKYNTHIKSTRPFILDKFDKHILDSAGFDHQPELQMLALAIKEVRSEVYDVVSTRILEKTEKKTSESKETDKKTSRGEFFFVGLGGGTGTGVISPLAEQFGKALRGHFTLGVLGGKEDDDLLETQQPWFRRCFNMLIALNDLMVTAGLDGLFLVDNDILTKKVGLENKENSNLRTVILEQENEITTFLKEEFNIDWVKKAKMKEVKPNELFHFTQDKNFAEINIQDEKAILEISDGRIYELEARKVNDRLEIGGRTNAQKVDEELITMLYPAFGYTALDREDTDFDWKQIKDHWKDHFREEGESPIFVPCYASSSSRDKKTSELIDDALNSGCLVELDPDDIKIADKVHVYLRRIEDNNEENIKATLKKHFKKDGGNEPEIRIIKVGASKSDLQSVGTAKIVVFESKELRGEESKKNEVLILLKNPNVNKALITRFKVVQGFIELLKRFIDQIDKGPGSLKEKIAREIIDTDKDTFKDLIGEGGPVDGITKIPTNGIKAEKLFCWDRITRDDKVAKEKLIKSLKDFFDIDMTEESDIEIKDENKIICKPNVESEAVIEIEIEKVAKGKAEGKATLKITDRRLCPLKVIKEGDEQWVYESENRALEKIMTEAKSFLFPSDVGAQKREETYRYMARIVKKLSYSVSYALNAIQKLDKSYMPLFDGKTIFEPISVTASDEEVLLTSILAMGKDTYMTYKCAVGNKKVENMFNDFQRKTLEGTRYVDNSGGDDGYILADDGEKVLSDQLKNKLNALSREIKKPSELLDEVHVADFLNFVEEANKVHEEIITFPKLLALSLLYTKWEYLFTLNREDEGIITEYLNCLGIGDAGQFTQIHWADDGIDQIGKIFSISNENTPETIDIWIDHLSEAEEDNIKRIHICSFLFDVTANKDFKIGLDKKSVTHELRNKFNTFPMQYKVVNEERGWMIVDTTTQAANNYYILKEKGQQEEGRLRVYADRTEDLKVRRSGKKLKVYRRRGKKP